jgi:N-acyl-D-amino-acid deacylase
MSILRLFPRRFVIEGLIMKNAGLLLALLSSVSLAFVSTGNGAQGFDVLVTHGRIVDGSGNPWYRGDIGIRGGRVAEIGNLEASVAEIKIDAHDSVVAPGFFDMMGGSSLPLIVDRTSGNTKLLQGVTTMLAGEGDSLAPQDDHTIAELQKRNHFTFGWKTFGDYFQILTEKGIPINVVHNVGAAQIREVVIGDQDRAPTALELERMKGMVAQAMKDGAVGVSTALIYPPGSYAKTDEIIQLAKVAAQYGGIYLSHMRNESGGLLDAIREVILIGREAKLPVHIYHLKAAGEANWPLVPKALALIEQARAEGIDVTADAYPYIYNGIDLASFIAPSHFAHGRPAFVKTLSDPAVRKALQQEIETNLDWENWYVHVGRDWGNVLVAEVPEGVDVKYEGMSIKQVAEAQGKDQWTAFFDLVAAGPTDVNPKSMNEEQKREIYSTDFVSVSSDAEPVSPAAGPHAHPRAFGTFPRILARYVREQHVMTLEYAVRAMTSLPADQLKLYDRGRLAPGMAADLVIFDPAAIQDTATYAHPASYSTGIEYVLVNGKVAVSQGNPTGIMAGSVIRHVQ